MTSTGVTITNPLVLYRAWVATSRIKPDPAQLRLALHLQRLYDRLKDYEPRVEYARRINSIGKLVKDVDPITTQDVRPGGAFDGIRDYFVSRKETRDSLALTKVLTDHDAAMQVDSPKGLMLHGEVGTGKSMLIDLFAGCLPTVKKRRWHFNTFMLDTIAQLEQYRRRRTNQDVDHSLLWLSRNLIQTSPVLFLDEFQLPDRMAAKIMTNLLTSFFQLGGVLIATSNRMPEELAKAAGMEFVAPRLSDKSTNGATAGGARLRTLNNAAKENAAFLELINARCDVWELEGRQDYRRRDSPGFLSSSLDVEDVLDEKLVLDSIAAPTSTSAASTDPVEPTNEAPQYYQVTAVPVSRSTGAEEWKANLSVHQLNALLPILGDSPSWVPTTLRVYGRDVTLLKTCNGVLFVTFDEICKQALGPADYISIASAFHTIIITDVPTLTYLLRHEARRLITLLDAAYEAKCKLMMSATASPDNLFFPELRPSTTTDTISEAGVDQAPEGGVYAETFSEIYQDLNDPFRPNIASYSDGQDRLSIFGRGEQSGLAADELEDDPPNRLWRDAQPDLDRRMPPNGIGVKSPDFSRTAMFTGEDEKFAYKRAASRLWEMCGTSWWARQEDGWWQPLSINERSWERGVDDSSHVIVGDGANINPSSSLPPAPGANEGTSSSREVNEKDDEVMFRHGASPFRRAVEPPPKIEWTHVWGTMKWGKKAGAWGQGVEGLKDRKKDDE